MNCQTLRDVIVDLARGEPVGQGSTAAVEAHVEYCASCAALLARERELSAGLRALALGTAAQVSPDVEARLRAAFADQHVARSFASRVARSGWLRAAAIVVVAAGAGIWWRSSGPAKDVDPHAGRETSPAVIFAEGFVPLPIALGLPDFESGEIIRVEIPVASLPSYGIEIAPDARRTPVQADLLVGQDGQPRAIRLVRRTTSDGALTP